jgi:hypothetical protein
MIIVLSKIHKGNVSESIASYLGLESSQSHGYALHKAEWVLDVKVVDLRACLSKDQQILVLALKCVSNNEVFDAGFLGPALERKDIGLLLLAPFCLLV